METVNEQIQKQQQNKAETLKDLFYVEYCNNCKEPLLKGKIGQTYTPCHHPWYCWKTPQVAPIEDKIGEIQHNINQRGYPFAHEIKQLKKLKNKRWKQIHKGRREYGSR